jgi:hypothetical protein
MYMEEKKQVTQEETPTGTVVTEERSTQPTPVERQEIAETKSAFRAYYLTYYVTGLIEVILAFTFVLKLLGADPLNGFVSFVYALGNVFLAPFSGIFQATTTEGAETVGVFDPAIIVAIAVYALIGWGVAKLINVLTAGRTPEA